MSIGSFSAGLSGLNANSLYLRVIGNNLANLNTVGFKASQVSFSDLVNQNVGGASEDPTLVGLGVSTGSIAANFSQGSIESTGVPTNVALQGSGFFVISGNDGVSYTRAGNFHLNSNGLLVTADGHHVQGYTQVNAQGQIVTSTQPGDIAIPPGVMRAPQATSTFATVSNLDAGAAVGATFSTSVQLLDSLGASHTASIDYTKSASNGWDYAITVDGGDVSGGTKGTPFTLTSGTVTFDNLGALATVNGAAPADVQFTTPAWTDGAAASPLTWDVVNTANVATLTGFAAVSATSSITQDGNPPGQLTNINIGTDGLISATIGSGETVALAQLSIAEFNNPQGLIDAGQNRFALSQTAGVPNVGVGGTGGRGTIVGGALEESNVDIAQEFTNMIIAQRGYQANAKSITVSDQLLQDTLNLKQ